MFLSWRDHYRVGNNVVILRMTGGSRVSEIIDDQRPIDSIEQCLVKTLCVA